MIVGCCKSQRNQKNESYQNRNHLNGARETFDIVICHVHNSIWLKCRTRASPKSQLRRA